MSDLRFGAFFLAGCAFVTSGTAERRDCAGYSESESDLQLNTQRFISQWNNYDLKKVTIIELSVLTEQ